VSPPTLERLKVKPEPGVPVVPVVNDDRRLAKVAPLSDLRFELVRTSYVVVAASCAVGVMLTRLPAASVL
jgi:hypothetical protein